jgi:hypothetical protein
MPILLAGNRASVNRKVILPGFAGGGEAVTQGKGTPNHTSPPRYADLPAPKKNGVRESPCGAIAQRPSASIDMAFRVPASEGPLSSLFRRNLGAFLASFRKADGNRLLAASNLLAGFTAF